MTTTTISEKPEHKTHQILFDEKTQTPFMIFTEIFTIDPIKLSAKSRTTNIPTTSFVLNTTLNFSLNTIKKNETLSSNLAYSTMRDSIESRTSSDFSISMTPTTSKIKTPTFVPFSTIKTTTTTEVTTISTTTKSAFSSDITVTTRGLNAATLNFNRNFIYESSITTLEKKAIITTSLRMSTAVTTRNILANSKRLLIGQRDQSMTSIWNNLNGNHFIFPEFPINIFGSTFNSFGVN